MKTYSECIKLKTFKERFEYLSIGGIVGESTFGGWAYLRERVYTGVRWRRLKNKLIIRDQGRDLAVEGHTIRGIVMFREELKEVRVPVVLHHINPIMKDDILYDRPCVYDPENLIICSSETHRAIHYGNYDLLADEPIIRRPNDTCPWKG